MDRTLSVDNAREVHVLLTAKLRAIRAFRRLYGRYPILTVADDDGQYELTVPRADGGQDILPARRLVPVHTAPGSGVLASCEYRRVLTLLVRQHQFIGDCIRHGVAVLVTHRAAWYALLGLEDFPTTGVLDSAIDTAAQVLDIRCTSQHLLFRKVMEGTLIAADVKIWVTRRDGTTDSGTYSQSRLRPLPYFEEGDHFDFEWLKQHAAIGITESDALGQNVVGCGGAIACNLAVVACHGRAELKHQYFVHQLSNAPGMEGKRVLGLSDFDWGGLVFVNAFGASSNYPVAIERVSLTGEQLFRDCDERLRLTLSEDSVPKLQGMVLRGTADPQTIEDAECMLRTRQTGNAEALQFPSANANHAAGEWGMSQYLQAVVNEALSRPPK